MSYKAPYTLFIRTFPSGKKVWYYRLSDDPKRVPHSTGVEGLKGRRYLAAEHINNLLGGNGDAPTLEEFAKDFFDWETSEYLGRRRVQKKRKQIGREAAAARQGHLNNYLIPKWGKYHLDRIEVDVFEQWLYNLDLSPQSKNHILYTMTLILKEARRLRKIQYNPLDGVEALDPAHRERDYLRREELERLFPRDMDEFMRVWPTIKWHKEPPINYGVMLALAVSGGLRSGEMRALRWKHVSWQNSGIAVVKAMKYKNEEGRPKQNSVRAVLLPQRTLDLLKWWYGKSKLTDPEDYVFPPRNRRNILLQLKAAMDRAKIDYKDRFLDVHALRHTYNTHMRDLIEDEKLRAFTGHRTASMSENYDHKEMIERLPRFAELRAQVNRFPI